MPQNNPEAFGLFAEWAYKGSLRAIEFPKPEDSADFNLQLIDLYLLSKKLLLKDRDVLSISVIASFATGTKPKTSLQLFPQATYTKTRLQTRSCGNTY